MDCATHGRRHPDLQGRWNYSTLTPLERPLSSREAVFTEDEAAAIREAGGSKRLMWMAIARPGNRTRFDQRHFRKPGSASAYNRILVGPGNKGRRIQAHALTWSHRMEKSLR